MYKNNIFTFRLFKLKPLFKFIYNIVVLIFYQNVGIDILILV